MANRLQSDCGLSTDLSSCKQLIKIVDIFLGRHGMFNFVGTLQG
ncbi:Uncharacterised protein [Vibrio cholerae]|nr:Uncharacterised protein [Vibrio cholerae]